MTQLANASANADLKIKDSFNNGPVYLVTVEDPTIKSKYREFCCLKFQHDSVTVSIVGFDIVSNKKETFALNSLKEVSEYVQKNNITLEDYKIPWTRVINVKNITYKQKV